MSEVARHLPGNNCYVLLSLLHAESEAGHLLRTPLTVIKASLQSMLRKWDDPDADRDLLKKRLVLALDQVDRLEHLIALAETRIFNNEKITISLEDAEKHQPHAREGTDVYESPLG